MTSTPNPPSNPTSYLLNAKKQKKPIKILGLNETLSLGLVFRIEIEGKIEWVKRNYFLPEYTVELLEFYESSILFKKP